MAHRRSDLTERDDYFTARLDRDHHREPEPRPHHRPARRWAFQCWAADVIAESANLCNAPLQPPVKIGGRP